ncbi:MAG: 3-methyl-2-oxobutanoate hydroxymethyltransferase [Lachnospiraceae bacterium]|nr:3-methyl-2-oxobutanoate hydroxymethyltransferase [Lachnospiraceae bacterium]
MGDKKKCTTKDFLRYKQEGQKWTWTICYDYTFAGIVDESKTEMILVGDSLGNVITGDGSTIPVTLDIIIHHIRSVVKGAPNTFVVGDMPFGTYNVSNEQAIATANRIMQEGGSDCVKLEGGAKMAPRIKAIVDAGIPVMAHIGLTPQSISQLGGFKVQGKDSSVADQLLADALAVEEAGAFGICLECMPVGVAKKITETVKIPCCGIGAGIYCDGQELNMYDMTGLFKDLKPKFVKHYAELRQPMVDALNAFYEDTVNGTFPTPEYSYNAKVEGYPVD